MSAELSEDQDVLESPHPDVVRETRVRAGISVEACIAAAEFKTKASWYQVESGKNQLPGWRWRKVLEVIERGDYKRSRRPVAKADFVPSELDPLVWVDDDRRVSIGLWLRELREAMRMSQSELAAAARMDYHTIEGLEAGESKSYLTTKRLRVLVATLRVRQARMREALNVARRASKVDGALLRSTREAFGLSQHDVGVWAGFMGARKGVMISAYELGQYAIPDSLAKALLSGCDALMRTVDDATGWQGLSVELGGAE